MQNITNKSLLFHNLVTKTYKLLLKENPAIFFAKTIFIAMVLISINSCEYPMDEEFIRQPEILNDSMMSITDGHNYLEVDTLYFTVGQIISFKPELKDYSINRIHSYELFLNGIIFDPENSFWYTMPETPGIYELHFKAYIQTRTGSIANISDLEKYIFEKKWVLIVYQTASYINNYFEDGRVKIEWEEFPYPFIKEYQISKSYYVGIYDLIGTTERNHFIDSTYIGYLSRCRITAITKGNSEVFWGEFIIQEDFPQMTVVESQEPCAQRKVMWNVPKAYNNVTSTLFYVNDTLQSTSYNVFDTVRSIENTTFGKEDIIHLYFISRTSNSATNYYNAKVKATSLCGYKYTSGNSGYVYQATDNLFVNIDQNKHIITYLPSGIPTGDALIMNSYKESSFCTSPDGTQFAFLTKSGEIKSGAVSNLNQLTTKPSVSQYEFLKVSDNKIACVKSGSSSLKFYDMNTLGEPESFSIGSTIENISDLSSDAKYFSVQTYYNDTVQVFKRGNGEFSKLHQLPFKNNSILKFNNLNPEQFFYWNEGIFYCRNINNAEIIYSYPLIADRILHIDISNNRMLVAYRNHLRIYRITDGTILHNIPFSNYYPDLNRIGHNSILIDNKIVSRSLMYCL